VIPGRCARQDDVRQAAVTGRWTNELGAHARACRTCGEVALVTAALSDSSTHAAARPPVTIAPVRLWAEAQQARRLRAEAIASRLVAGVQITTAALVVGALAFVGAQVDFRALVSGNGNTVLVSATAALLLAAMGVTSWLSQDA